MDRRRRTVVVVGVSGVLVAALGFGVLGRSGDDPAAQRSAIGAADGFTTEWEASSGSGGTPTPAGGSQHTLADRLDPGTSALSVTLDATRAVGGMLRPGDRVNILVPGQCPDEAAAVAEAAATGGEARCRRARILYQAVRVLAVDGQLDQGASADALPEAGGGVVTAVLALPPRAALWVASWENELWFSLVGPDYVPSPVPPLPTVVGELPGEQSGVLIPECPDPPVSEGSGPTPGSCRGEVQP